MESRVHGIAPPGVEEGPGTKTPKDNHSKLDPQDSFQGQLKHKVHQALGTQANLR